MNEAQFGDRIRHLLNQSLELDTRTAGRLRAARETALARQRPEPAPALAWADNVLGTSGGWAGVSLRLILPLILLVASAGTLYNWQQKQLAAEVEEIDVQLLSDDLPIDAYLDRGFQNWLKTRAEEQ